MIIDDKGVYAENQAITGDSDSTKTLDHGAADAKIGDGTNMSLVINVTADFTFGTATGLTFQLMDSADGSNFDEVLQSDEFVAAELTKGKRIVIPLPPGLRRHTKVHYKANGTITAGTVSAFLVKDVPSS